MARVAAIVGNREAMSSLMRMARATRYNGLAHQREKGNQVSQKRGSHHRVVCMVVASCKGGHLETAFELFCDGARAGTVRVGSWTRREGLVEAPLVRRILAQLSGGDGGRVCG